MSGLEFFLDLKVVQPHLLPPWGARHHAELLKAVHGEVDFLGGSAPVTVWGVLLRIEQNIIHVLNKVFDQGPLGVALFAVIDPFPSVIEIDGVFILGFGNHAETGP